MTAKVLNKITLLLSFALLFAACEEKPENPIADPEITLGATENSYGFEKGSDVVSFSIANPVEGQKAEVKSNASWVQIADVSKSSFKFNYDENKDYSDRTAVLTVSYGKAKPVTFTVHQQAAPAPIPDPEITLEVTDATCGFESSFSVVSFAIVNPVAGEKVEVSTDAAWVKISDISNTSFKYNVEENKEYSERTAILIISYGKAKPVTFTLHQQAAPVPDPEIIPETAEINLGYQAGNGSFAVAVENPTTAFLEASSDADWLKVEVTTSNGWVVKYSYDANGIESVRTATITLKYANAEAKTVKVSQDVAPAPVIELDFSTLNFGNFGGSTSLGFTVYNPIPGKKLVVTTDSPEWIEIDYIYEHNIQFSVWRNPELSPRQGKIFFDYEGAERQTLVIKQAAGVPDPEIVLTTASMEVGPEAGDYKFSFKINNPVSGQSATVVSANPDWITVTEYNDDGATFTVSQNTAADGRQGKIFVYYSGAPTQTFVVTQNGFVPKSEIIVDKTEVNLAATSGSGSFSVEIVNPSDASLTATSDQSWLKVEVVKSTGWTVKYTYTANEAEDPRDAVVTLKYGNAEDKTVSFTQKGKEAVVVPDPVIVLGQSKVQASCDGDDYSISIQIKNPVSGRTAKAKASADWITVTSVSNTAVKFTVKENATTSSRKAKITVSYTGATDKSIEVTQDAKSVEPEKPVIKVSAKNVNITSDEQELVLKCTIENPVQGKSSSATFDNVSWVSRVSSGTNEIRLKVNENTVTSDRSFNVTWTYPGADDVNVTVTQKAAEPVASPEITLASNNVVLDKFGTSVQVPYTIKNAPAALQYLIIDKPDWLNAGYNESEKYIIFSAGENKTGADRTASVTVHAWFKGGVETSTTITVKQSCQDWKLTISPTSATKDYKAGTITVSVTLEGSASGTVQFKSTGNWVSLSKYSSTSLTMEYEQNNSKSDRSATITITYPKHAPATFQLTQKGNPNIPDNVVDLGGGLLWATENIGATKSTDAGHFFAWGEKQNKGSFSWTNYAFGTDTSLNKYTGSSYQLTSDDDVATQTLGKGWRMPTNIEWLELEDYCDFTETAVSGVNGIKITSRKTGQSIFLPYAGYKDGTATKEEGRSLYLWTSTRPHANSNDQQNGWSFYGEGCTAMPRYLGMPVRAVFDPSK